MMSTIVNYIAATPRFRGKGRLLQFLLPTVKRARSFYGVTLETRPGDLTNLYCIGGFYGTDLSERILQIEERSAVFLDIGANAGLFSLIAAGHLTEGYAFAFEPNPSVYAMLMRNREANRLENLIGFNLALGASNRLLNLSIDPRHTGAAHLTADRPTYETRVQVPVVTFDSLAVVTEICKGRRIYVKVDVEGYECEVLEGLLKSAVASRVEWVTCEIDGALLQRSGRSVEDLYALMEREGLRPRIGLSPRTHYDEVFVRMSREKEV